MRAEQAERSRAHRAKVAGTDVQCQADSIRIGRTVNLDHYPLALHIRALRQWHGEHGLEQAELAELAGISRHVLYRLESCRELPPTIEAFFAVAYALGVSPDALLDPRERQRIEVGVAARREQLERDTPYAEQ